MPVLSRASLALGAADGGKAIAVGLDVGMAGGGAALGPAVVVADAG